MPGLRQNKIQGESKPRMGEAAVQFN